MGSKDATARSWGNISDMADPRAELSSVTTALSELLSRLSSIAEQAADHDDTIAADLFEVERAMAGALRRLERVVAARG